MNEHEIVEVIDGFVAAAVRAQQAGFDGIELFAAYHALIDQFWLPWSNRRDDQWGGTFENRMRFSRTICERIRARVGDDFVIGLAVSVDRHVDVAMHTDELCEIAAWHDDRGLMDYITCGTASYFDFAELIPTFQAPPQLGVPMAAALRAAVRHARVQAESHIRTPDAAEAGHRRRARRHGQHRPRADRRPAPGGQGARRPSRRGAHLHLVQPDVLGSTLARLLDLVPRQSVGRS